MPNPKSTAQIAGHPIHPMLIPFPIACFVLTLISDLGFWRTSNDFWASASLWLLGIGLIMAALAAVTVYGTRPRQAALTRRPTSAGSRSPVAAHSRIFRAILI
jgi:uncharacterized membrane protein